MTSEEDLRCTNNTETCTSCDCSEQTKAILGGSGPTGPAGTLGGPVCTQDTSKMSPAGCMVCGHNFDSSKLGTVGPVGEPGGIPGTGGMAGPCGPDCTRLPAGKWPCACDEIGSNSLTKAVGPSGESGPSGPADPHLGGACGPTCVRQPGDRIIQPGDRIIQPGDSCACGYVGRSDPAQHTEGPPGICCSGTWSYQQQHAAGCEEGRDAVLRVSEARHQALYPDLGPVLPHPIAQTEPNVTALPSHVEFEAVVEAEVLSRVNLKSFLIEQDGKFVGIDFIKNNKVKRAINGRLGVVYPLKGGANNSQRLANSYLTIFDVKAGGYRNINLETVSRVRAQHKIFDVLDVDGKTPIIVA
jgi:hypothetical protein